MKIRFAPFMLDLDTRQLARGSRNIHLAPKAFELLTTLVLDRPKVLSKAVLQHRLWPDTFVEEANVSNLVAEIRAALGDPAHASRFIRTTHGFGYAFCGEATVIAGVRGPEPNRSSCWLQWGQQRIALATGTNVVGRGPGVDISLDASTVSRRHARLVVSAEGALLEDFGSKNGTFRAGTRVMSPARLVDGDAIRFGLLLVTFHAGAPLGATATAEQPTP